MSTQPLILVAEDNDVLREQVITHLLSTAGYRVSAVASAEEAPELAAYAGRIVARFS